MKLVIAHPWDLAVNDAKALQVRLAAQVITQTTFDPAELQTVAGVDVSYRQGVARAAVVVLDLATHTPVDSARAELPISFPYVPGLLTFREGPGVLAALEKLRVWPDLLIFDGHGLAHPRRLGLAAHMGVLLDQPSIGCAKSRLIGQHIEPDDAVGHWVPLYDQDEIIGAVLQSRRGVKPIYVSIGHRVDLETAVQLVLRCTSCFRLPETTRLAHRLAGGADVEMAVPPGGLGTPSRGPSL